MFNPGDVITRTVAGKTDSITLPPINLDHLVELTVDGHVVSGFHVLPASIITITSTTPIVLPLGAVTVVDTNGTPVAGTQVRLTPSRAPTDRYDAFEARVEVLDASGTLLAVDVSKSFYPQAWTASQIQEAIYTAYVQHYLAGGTEFFKRLTLRSPKGVLIIMRVSGNLSATGVKLKEIPTAYLEPLQHLNASHVP
jgi:hypothetical protein